jgi:carbon monoxide dehydrogenase subunit G
VRLGGQVEIAAPINSVWELVVNPVSIAGCVPGVRDMQQGDDRSFTGTVTAAVGPIEGDFRFRSVLSQVGTHDLVVRVDGTDSVTGSLLEADVEVSLSGADERPTVLDYRANLRVKGRLAILGEMVLRATANAMIGQVVRCLRQRLEAPPIGPEPRAR